MRRIIILVFVSCLTLLACKKKEDVVLAIDELDYNEESIKLMDSIRPNFLGTWNMKEIKVKAFAPFTTEIGIYKDTILNDLAVLELTGVDNYSQQYYNENNDITGVLKFRNKIFPVGFTMRSSGERILKKIGPQAFALFEYRFPVGSHPSTIEEDYLGNLSLLAEVYSMEMSPDGKTMVWKGLNRAIKEIQFVKNNSI
ncbi:hypothetical protein ADIARSV_0458 [Arcticibacter svalbardensis MN12-7]|uniref:Uncharacterized protein n=1 Tax=Arcticibacter svalbardensis MN12-7 TaxID=1150600 RepID=R9GXF5_9SPHI|nr:hypothetical protein [Arcticibacter svalbardensis]EOR96353.1 hypothetical protein ADIARSV_0458 [Arcticibacter svalbardensis MN12-7]